MKGKGKLSLILGSHAHVPSGSSESDFEYVYENKMRPFVSNLYRYSKIQAILHYSGVLLYWVERTHPEFFMLIEDMIARKQAEIIGGGFYEPMLPLIPLQDRIAQIELLTTYLRKHFGKRPLGCWIPGMVWEQHLAAALSASDISFTFLSQNQFLQAGMAGEDLYYPCISEDQGKIVVIFPVSAETENALTENSCSKVFLELKNRLEEKNMIPQGGSIITVFPEKTSSSPEESPDNAWNRFFEELSLSEDFIETTLPGKILKNHRPYKKAAFPNSSCFDDNFSPRRFLIEHQEVNSIYSKMIFTNVLISQLKGDRSRKQNAREELMKAQDSVLFTPGNGYLRNDLRKAAYSSLLCAERMSREKGRFTTSLIQYDFDLNGIPEYLFQDLRINCYIQQKGAGIFELDYLPKVWNYLDCGCVASSRRTTFADALLPPDADAESASKILPDGSRLCFHEQYEAASQDRKGKSCFRLPPAEQNLPFASIEIEKCYSLKKDILSVVYILKNSGKEQQNFCFVPLINFSFAGEGEQFVRFETDKPTNRIINNTETLKILDIKNEVQILLGSSTAFSGCIAPVYCDSLYQATRILPVFSVSLKSGETWTNEFSLKFSH